MLLNVFHLSVEGERQSLGSEQKPPVCWQINVCVQREEGLSSMLDLFCWNKIQQLRLDTCSFGQTSKKAGGWGRARKRERNKLATYFNVNLLPVSCFLAIHCDCGFWLQIGFSFPIHWHTECSEGILAE